MALTRGFIRNAATTPLDARLMDMAQITCDTSGAPRAGVMGGQNVSIVATTATMNVTVAAAEFVTTKGKADGVAIFTNDGSVNVLIGAAPASNSRIDVIWVKHEDNTTGDAASLPIFGVTAGTAAASPTKPAIPTGALELATLRIFSGTTATNGGSNTLTNTYQMTNSRGGVVPFRTRADMDAVTNLPAGTPAVVLSDSNTALRGGWVFDGTRWRPDVGPELQEAFTWSSANVDDSPQYPALTDDAANTTDSTIATIDAQGIKLVIPGTYHIAFAVRFPVAATGRSFAQIGADTDLVPQRAFITTGEDQMMVNQIVRTTTANQLVQIWFLKHNASLGVNTGRVVVRRLG